MRGFTILELLIVLGISAILVGISASVYTALNRGSSIGTEARKLESVLNLARNKTLASENEQSHGVHINVSSNEYTSFSGSLYDPSSPENELFIIPAQISIGSLQIRGGGSDIIFARLSGETAQYGSFIVQDAGDESRFQTICIDASGTVEVRPTCAATFLEYASGTIDADLASFPANSGFGDPAQSFTTASEDIYVRQVDLYLRRTVSNPSDVYLEIRAVSSVGSVLARSWMIDGSSLSSALDWIVFVFPDPVFLAANTQYFLRLRSLPDSTIAFSGAQGFIYWGYEHSASAPPAYPGGDAWRYVGRLDNPADAGEQLGPSDQYDFSFRILYGIDPPPTRDSRHMEFDLEDSSDRGWTIQSASTLRLVFHDSPGADVTENVSMTSYFNGGNTKFDWEGSTDVNGDTETLRVHTHYIDTNDTTLSIHRDRGINNKAVDISIDGRDIVSYTADGTPTVGTWGGNMVYR